MLQAAVGRVGASRVPFRHPRLARTCPLHSTDDKDLGEAIEAFLKAEKVPAFLEFSQQTSQAIFGSGIPNQVGRRHPL